MIRVLAVVLLVVLPPVSFRDPLDSGAQDPDPGLP